MNKKVLAFILLFGMIGVLVGCTDNKETSVFSSESSLLLNNNDEDILNTYINNLFTEEQINDSGSKYNELTTDYRYMRLQDLYNNNCVEGEKIYTVGLFNGSELYLGELGNVDKRSGWELITDNSTVYDTDYITFKTSTDYGFGKNIDPKITCVCGTCNLNRQMTGEIICTGAEALKYMKMYSDEGLVKKYKEKCLEMGYGVNFDTIKDIFNYEINLETEYGVIKTLGSDFEVSPKIAVAHKVNICKIENNNIKINDNLVHDLYEEEKLLLQRYWNELGKLMNGEFNDKLSIYEKKYIEGMIESQLNLEEDKLLFRVCMIPLSDNKEAIDKERYIKVTGKVYDMNTDPRIFKLVSDDGMECLVNVSNYKYSIGERHINEEDNITLYGIDIKIGDDIAIINKFAYIDFN